VEVLCYFHFKVSKQTVGGGGGGGGPELLLGAHELDEVVLSGLAPLQVHGGAVHHLGGQEETSRLLEQPLLRGGMLLQGGDRVTV